MHQYKTVAQILLILSIFNLVLTAPVVREIHNTPGEVAVPVVVKDVTVVSKERRQSTDGPSSSHSSPPPDESTPSPPPPPPDGSMLLHSSAQFSDGPTPSNSPPPLPDGSIPSHSSPQFPDESTLPHSPPPLSDVSTPSQSSLPLQDGSMPSHSLPPGTGMATLPLVPATFQPHLAEPVPPDPMMEEAETYTRKVIAGGAIMGITAILVMAYRHHNHHHRTIDSDWYVPNPFHFSCRRLNVLNHEHLTYEIFSSSIAKGSWHPCPDN